MPRSMLKKASTLILSTATGFALWSAQPGFSQDGPPAWVAFDGPVLPSPASLEPPRPAIRPPAPQPEKPAPKPPKYAQTTAGSPQKSFSRTAVLKQPERSPRPAVSRSAQPEGMVQLLAPTATAPPRRPTAALIQPGDSRVRTGYSLPVIVPRFPPPKSAAKEAQQVIPSEPVPALNPVSRPAPPPGYLPPPAPPAESGTEKFEMPIAARSAGKPISAPEIATAPVVTTQAEPPASTNAVPRPTNVWKAIPVSTTALAPAAKAVETLAPAAALPIGLEGFCPVTLREGRTRVQGSRQFASPYQGKLYLMASAQARRRFEDYPELYAPALGGRDVVQSSGSQAVPGSLTNAVWYQRQLYLFQDEGSLKTFTANPEKYLADKGPQADRPNQR